MVFRCFSDEVNSTCCCGSRQSTPSWRRGTCPGRLTRLCARDPACCKVPPVHCPLSCDWWCVSGSPRCETRTLYLRRDSSAKLLSMSQNPMSVRRLEDLVLMVCQYSFFLWMSNAFRRKYTANHQHKKLKIGSILQTSHPTDVWQKNIKNVESAHESQNTCTT